MPARPSSDTAIAQSRRVVIAAGAAGVSERTLLLTLALGNFVLGTGAFVLPALLQPLAGDLGVSLPAAGWLMSGYALAYAVTLAAAHRADRPLAAPPRPARPASR